MAFRQYPLHHKSVVLNSSCWCKIFSITCSGLPMASAVPGPAKCSNSNRDIFYHFPCEYSGIFLDNYCKMGKIHHKLYGSFRKHTHGWRRQPEVWKEHVLLVGQLPSSNPLRVSRVLALLREGQVSCLNPVVRH